MPQNDVAQPQGYTDTGLSLARTSLPVGRLTGRKFGLALSGLSLLLATGCADSPVISTDVSPTSGQTTGSFFSDAGTQTNATGGSTPYVPTGTGATTTTDPTAATSSMDGGANLRDAGSQRTRDGGTGTVTPTPVPGPTGTSDASVPVAGSKTAATYYVENGRVYDPCGEELVMRGVNHPTIYVDRAGAAFPDIARTGANVVRLFWYGGNGEAITELEPAIIKAVANGMVPMLEMHDSTGSWDLGPIVGHWTSSDAVALIKRHEKHLFVNIANEASPSSNEEFASGYKSAVQRMRAAGIHVPLVIDAGRWGRDYEMLLAKGRELLDADSDHNLIMSAHLYDALSTAEYASIYARARAQQLPFIVGEFANREPPGCGNNIDYASLINEANKAGIGWLAWSWGDNDPNTAWNADCAEFDMTSTFAFDSLQGWGRDVAVAHAASIQKTAKRPYAITHGDACR